MATDPKTQHSSRRAPERFTATSLAAKKPGEYTDPGCAGLQLRVRAKAAGNPSRAWLFRYKWGKQWVRIAIGQFPRMSLADAREKAQGLRRRIDEGIDPRRALPRRGASPVAPTLPPVASGGEHVLENVINEFTVRYLRAGNRRRPEYAEAILAKDVAPEWAGRDVRAITARDVIALLDKIVARGSKVMANRTAALLGQFFKFAIHRGLLESSPVQLLFRPGGRERPRQRTLSEAELAAFLKDPRACTRFERLERVIILLLLTGQRRGELAAAEWRHVNLKAGTWAIPAENSKTERGQIVPLSSWAVEEFKALKREGENSAYVLPDKPRGTKPLDPKQLTRSLARCRSRFQELGIEPFNLHDLRRTCRTGLARLKVPPHIAERVLGHAQEKIAGTYDVHDYLDEKREALDKWAAYLEGLKP